MISLGTTLALFIASVSVIFIWLQHSYSYWKRKNVPYVKPVAFFGNIKELMLCTDNAANHLQKLYNNKETSSEPVVGIYLLLKPGLLIRQPELIRQILVKDFNKFSNRFSASNHHYDEMGANALLLVKNPKWKQIRKMLSPFFTSGMIKLMFPLIEEVI